MGICWCSSTLISLLLRSQITWLLRLFLAIWQCIAIQRNIYIWCFDHRIHHKYCATNADPQNIKKNFFKLILVGFYLVDQKKWLRKKITQLWWCVRWFDRQISKKIRPITNRSEWSNLTYLFNFYRYYVTLVAIFWLIFPTLVPYY